MRSRCSRGRQTLEHLEHIEHLDYLGFLRSLRASLGLSASCRRTSSAFPRDADSRTSRSSPSTSVRRSARDSLSKLASSRLQRLGALWSRVRPWTSGRASAPCIVGNRGARDEGRAPQTSDDDGHRALVSECARGVSSLSEPTVPRQFLQHEQLAPLMPIRRSMPREPTGTRRRAHWRGGARRQDRGPGSPGRERRRAYQVERSWGGSTDEPGPGRPKHKSRSARHTPAPRHVLRSHGTPIGVQYIVWDGTYVTAKVARDTASACRCSHTGASPRLRRLQCSQNELDSRSSALPRVVACDAADSVTGPPTEPRLLGGYRSADRSAPVDKPPVEGFLPGVPVSIRLGRTRREPSSSAAAMVSSTSSLAPCAPSRSSRGTTPTAPPPVSTRSTTRALPGRRKPER